MKGEVRVIQSKGGVQIKDTGWMKNTVVLSKDRGRNLIIKRLAGKNTYSLNITHIDIGFSDTSPTEDDQTLGDAQARMIAFVEETTLSSVTFHSFFPDDQTPNGTYHEVGAYVDGDNSVDTGRLFNRVLFTTSLEKNSGTDTTVRVRLYDDTEVEETS